MKNRRDFIRNLVLAGAALYLPACDSEKETTQQVQQQKAQTQEQQIEQVVQEISEQFESENLVLLRADDTQYNELNIGFNTRVPKQPKIIALCKNNEGIVEAIKYAKFFDLQVCVKSGGHSFEGFSSNDGGMSINLSLFDGIEWIDDETVKMGAGVKLFEVYDALLPKGKIIPAGSCATVGIAGLTLGGGYGLFARKYGLTCDSLVGLTMIDGNGNIHEASEDSDLMWACRGGNNGNFGIVSELIFKVHPTPSAFTRHRFKAYKLDGNRAKSLMENWFRLTAQLPDSCFAAYVLNGKTLTILITDADNRRAEIQPLLDEFTAITDKQTFGTPTTNLAKSLSNYYGLKTPLYFKNACAGLYKDYNDIEGCIESVIQKVQENPGMIMQINTLGGQISNPKFEAKSSFPHRSFPYMGELQAYPEHRPKEPLVKAFDDIQKVFTNHGIDRHYRNYPDLNFENWEYAYYRDNYKRLQEIKKKFDPDNVIWHPQSVKA
ncbi:MAG: FAD-dependent oxidoreductase [Saprospiraceae bacterium]